jgi:hypothetical protein
MINFSFLYQSILGLEPRVYHHMGLIRSENPKMVQLQVNPQTKEVQSIS